MLAKKKNITYLWNVENMANDGLMPSSPKVPGGIEPPKTLPKIWRNLGVVHLLLYKCTDFKFKLYNVNVKSFSKQENIWQVKQKYIVRSDKWIQEKTKRSAMVLRKVTFQLLKGDLLHDESSPSESRFLFHWKSNCYELHFLIHVFMVDRFTLWN